jgi:hypothetical protein
VRSLRLHTTSSNTTTKYTCAFYLYSTCICIQRYSKQIMVVQMVISMIVHMYTFYVIHMYMYTSSVIIYTTSMYTCGFYLYTTCICIHMIMYVMYVDNVIVNK